LAGTTAADAPNSGERITPFTGESDSQWRRLAETGSDNQRLGRLYGPSRGACQGGKFATRFRESGFSAPAARRWESAVGIGGGLVGAARVRRPMGIPLLSYLRSGARYPRRKRFVFANYTRRLTSQRSERLRRLNAHVGMPDHLSPQATPDRRRTAGVDAHWKRIQSPYVSAIGRCSKTLDRNANFNPAATSEREKEPGNKCTFSATHYSLS